MDIKITKKRLANVLNYEWLLSIVCIIGAIVLWSLLYTMLATRLTDGQQFYFVKYEGVYTNSADADSKFIENLRNGGGRDGKSVLSYDVYAVNLTEIMSAGGYSAYAMLDLRLTTGEGDVIVIGGGNKEYVEGESMSDLLSLVSSRRLMTIDELLSGAYEYTVGNGFISETGEIQEEKIEDYFRNVRIKSARNYRRMYNSEEKIREGVKNEIDRIHSIYQNYIVVSSAIEAAKEAGEDFLWYSKPVYVNSSEVSYGDQAAYGIDLSKLKEYKIGNGIWHTYDESGNSTVDGLVFAVINDSAIEQYDLRYESLAVIEYIIRTYSEYA